MPAAFSAHANAQGGLGLATQLACRELAEELVLCFNWNDGDVRKYVTLGHLVEWGLDLDGAEKLARTSCEEAVKTRPMTTQEVDGMSATYQVRSEGDGCDGALMLWPSQVQSVVGISARVAVPARGVFLAWAAGSAEVDQAVGIGVRRIFEAADHGVSPKVYRWQETSSPGWVVWGEALPGLTPGETSSTNSDQAFPETP